MSCGRSSEYVKSQIQLNIFCLLPVVPRQTQATADVPKNNWNCVTKLKSCLKNLVLRFLQQLQLTTWLCKLLDFWHIASSSGLNASAYTFLSSSINPFSPLLTWLSPVDYSDWVWGDQLRDFRFDFMQWGYVPATEQLWWFTADVLTPSDDLTILS